MDIERIYSALKDLEKYLERIESLERSVRGYGVKRVKVFAGECAFIDNVKVLDGDAEVISYHYDKKTGFIIIDLLVRSWATTKKGKKYIKLHITYRPTITGYPRFLRPHVTPENAEDIEVPKDFVLMLVAEAIERLKRKVEAMGYKLNITWSVEKVGE